jgi:type IV pilus assembly protein PilF
MNLNMNTRTGRIKSKWAPFFFVLFLSLQLMGCAGVKRDVVTASDETEPHKRARIRIELATAYFGQGQLNTALDEIKQAIATDPSIGAAYNLRGLIYASLSEDSLAEDSFRKALQIDVNDGSAIHNFGWFLCQRNRFDEAQNMFTQALANPKYRDTLQTNLAQGVCYARAGKLQEAENVLLRAYEIDSANPIIAMNLADVLYRRGQYERARFYIRRVNSVANLANAETLWLAIRIERKMGNRAGVSDFGNQLRSRFPSSKEAGYYERNQFND